jgi:membrane associated rhomboid family serine protease
MLDVFLIVSVVTSGYWSWFHLARGRRLFAAMLAGAALLCLVSLAGADDPPDPWATLAGVVGLGASVILVIVGPFVRLMARRAAFADRLRLAGMLLEVAEVLQPGAGVGDDKDALASLRDVRSGNIDEAVAALQRSKSRLPGHLGQAIDERITMLYLSAHRWADAIAHVDRSLAALTPPRPLEETGESERAAAAALGMSPPLWIELMAAVARTGDIARAARMLQDLERSCAELPEAFLLLHRGRLVFLAFSGRQDAVEKLLDKKLASHMTEAARSYWRAVSAQHAGDHAEARTQYRRALGKSRGRARDLVEQAMQAVGQEAPVALSPEVAAEVDRAEHAPLVRPPHLAPRRRWITTGLVLANVIVAGLMAWMWGGSQDVGAAVRAGALWGSAVDSGEYWRLAASLFVHFGTLHLLVNMLSLWTLGRWSERMFSSEATAVIYGLSGLVGAFASYLGNSSGVAAGASGAVFGLVGAMLMEVTVHRDRHRAVWQSGLGGSLIVVTAAQLMIGMTVPNLDQWAHGGGFITGAALSLLLSPHAARRIPARAVMAMALALALAGGYAALMVATTSVAHTLGKQALVTRNLEGVELAVPAGWEQSAGEELRPGVRGADVGDPGVYFVLAVRRRQTASGSFERWASEDLAEAKERGFSSTEPAARSLLPASDLWHSAEYLVTASSEIDDTTYRVIIIGRDFAGTFVTINAYLPESLARSALPALQAMLSSAHLAP